MIRPLISIILLTTVSACSTTQYNDNGVGAFIPYESNPRYSNIVVANKPYVPAPVAVKTDPVTPATPLLTSSKPVADQTVQVLTGVENENATVTPPAITEQLPLTEFVPAPSDNVVVTTLTGDVVIDKQTKPAIAADDYLVTDKEVSYQMRPGLLKPQLVQLLLKHPNIKDPSGIIWNARDNLIWPNNYRVKNKDLDHVLNDILSTYNVSADFRRNNAVIITGGI